MIKRKDFLSYLIRAVKGTLLIKRSSVFEKAHGYVSGCKVFLNVPTVSNGEEFAPREDLECLCGDMGVKDFGRKISFIHDFFNNAFLLDRRGARNVNGLSAE